MAAKGKKAQVKKEPTAEDHAAEIAEKISECAKELRRRPCDLTWAEFREYGGIAWGLNRIGLVRKDITKLGGFNAIRDSYFPGEPTDQNVTRQRLRQHAALNRKLGSGTNERRFILDEIERLSRKVFSGRIQPVRAQYKLSGHPRETERVVTLVLSDLHFGSDLKAEETGVLDYGRVEEARRLAQVVKQAIEYKPEHRGGTELRVLLDGDLIHGALHDPRDGAEMSEQICRAIHLLSQAIAHLAAHFKRVSVHCVTGNHGRMLMRHHGRATVGKWDSNETVIYSAVRMCCLKLPNVTFSIPRKPYDTYEDFGQKVFLTHGDTVLRPGNPGKAIQTGALENQVNRWNATLRDEEEYAVFVMGHVHTPMVTRLTNGAWVVTNGCLIPADNFCVSIGIPETVCAQVIYESVQGHPVGDLRLITLDGKVDRDASLDQIIKPWSGF